MSAVADWQETATQLRRVWKLADHDGLPRQVGPNMAERMLALGDALVAQIEALEQTLGTVSIYLQESGAAGPANEVSRSTLPLSDDAAPEKIWGPNHPSYDEMGQ